MTIRTVGLILAAIGLSGLGVIAYLVIASSQ